MVAISQETRPDEYRLMTIGNLRRQFDLLRDLVSVGLTTDFKINHQIITVLHGVSSMHLVSRPGHYRTEPVHITGSKHTPPEADDVQELMFSYLREIHRLWNSETNHFILAAFVLWKLVWIHPFEDGNGRTARALTYLVICLKLRRWLPGTNTLLSLIKDHSEEYTAHLRHADLTHAAGEVDLVPMANYLAKLTKAQLQSVS